MKLCVKNAEYHYDFEKNNGFRDVSFDLDQPGVMSILGPNGCGKTTLLKCIDGLMKLQGGSISINGKDLSELSRVELAKFVGYVPSFISPVLLFQYWMLCLLVVHLTLVFLIPQKRKMS
jgi:iron complex transport system ATP-binding protein